MNTEIRERKYALVDASAEADEKVFRGKCIAFDSWSINLGGFKEMITRSAWDSADFSECLAVFNHKEDNLLGSYASGTLRFNVKDDGVYTEIDKADTSISRDCAEWVKRGDVSGQSFKFTVLEDAWVKDPNSDMLLCTITKLGKIYDTSLVTRPSYLETSVNLRGLDLEAIKTRLSETHEDKKEENNRNIFKIIQNKINNR